jgi:tetratricopeptide (TPR) repeat protein
MYIGMARRDVGQIDDAEAIFRDGLEASRKSLGNDHRVTLHFMNQLGEVLAKQNKFDEAEQLLGEALETRRRVYGSHHKLVGETLLALSDLRFRQGRVAEAEVLAREVVLQQEKNPDRTKGWARRTLLQALLKQDKYVEARPYWLQEREALRVAADDSLATAEQKEAYARFLLTSDPERWQDPETALAYAQRAAASADGKTARIHFTLARAYSVSGDVLHADSVLEQALLLVSPSESAMREEIEILQRNIDATGGPQR